MKTLLIAAVILAQNTIIKPWQNGYIIIQPDTPAITVQPYQDGWQVNIPVTEPHIDSQGPLNAIPVPLDPPQTPSTDNDDVENGD